MIAHKEKKIAYVQCVMNVNSVIDFLLLLVLTYYFKLLYMLTKLVIVCFSPAIIIEYVLP